MIAWNKGQTVTWSRGHVMDRFRPGQAPRRPATAFNPDRPRNRPTDRQTTRINQPDRPSHRGPVASPLLSSPPGVRSSSPSASLSPALIFFSIFPSFVIVVYTQLYLFSPSFSIEFSKFREISKRGLHGPPRLNNVNYVVLNLDTRRCPTRRLWGKTAGHAPIDNDLIRSDVTMSRDTSPPAQCFAQFRVLIRDNGSKRR